VPPLITYSTTYATAPSSTTSGTHIQVQQQMGSTAHEGGDGSRPAYPGSTTIWKRSSSTARSTPAFTTPSPAECTDADFRAPWSTRPTTTCSTTRCTRPGRAVDCRGAGQTVLVRFLNAAALQGAPGAGRIHDLVAENAYPYPYGKIQYNALVSAGKTVDATAPSPRPARCRCWTGSLRHRGADAGSEPGRVYNTIDLQILLLYLNGVWFPCGAVQLDPVGGRSQQRRTGRCGRRRAHGGRTRRHVPVVICAGRRKPAAGLPSNSLQQLTEGSSA